ncbi:hypothetical protein ACWEQ7_28160 [Streptomyces sp. NPDC004069]
MFTESIARLDQSRSPRAPTGAIYADTKVVEHWDDIKEGAGKAADWVGSKTKDLGKSIAKSKANPMNWF